MKLDLEAETLIMGDVPLSQACMIELLLLGWPFLPFLIIVIIAFQELGEAEGRSPNDAMSPVPQFRRSNAFLTVTPDGKVNSGGGDQVLAAGGGFTSKQVQPPAPAEGAFPASEDSQSQAAVAEAVEDSQMQVGAGEEVEVGDSQMQVPVAEAVEDSQMQVGAGEEVEVGESELQLAGAEAVEDSQMLTPTEIEQTPEPKKAEVILVDSGSKREPEWEFKTKRFRLEGGPSSGESCYYESSSEQGAVEAAEEASDAHEDEEAPEEVQVEPKNKKMEAPEEVQVEPKNKKMEAHAKRVAKKEDAQQKKADRKAAAKAKAKAACKKGPGRKKAAPKSKSVKGAKQAEFNTQFSCCP